ncbi:hypothetical protein ABH965_005842, partial [Bacillus sp. RC97]
MKDVLALQALTEPNESNDVEVNTIPTTVTVSTTLSTFA